MEWNLSPEQDAYQEAFRGWLSDVAPPDAVRRWLDAGDAAAFEKLFADGGWGGVGLPEKLARVAAPSAGWLATVLAVPALALAGHRDLAELALAGETAAYLMSAECVPDEAPPLSVDETGAISGSVPRVLSGGTAVRFVVPAGRELRLVEASGPEVTRTERKLLDRSRSVADVTLDRAPVPAARARRSRPGAAPGFGACGRPGGRRLPRRVRPDAGPGRGPQQAAPPVRRPDRLVPGGQGGPDAFLHAAAVKAQVTAEGARTADSALTVHGAIGYTWESDLQLFYKRARLDEKLLGTPAQWNERIAVGLALV